MAKNSTELDLLCLFFTSLILSHAVLANTAYPTIPGTHDGDCPAASDALKPVRREVYGNGRIYDITHRYRKDMPLWDSKDGLGQFVWLPVSMKNGSLANSSKMMLPAHSGTHVDAPGHTVDHYFDAGFDVDTLDLDVLNGNDRFIVCDLRVMIFIHRTSHFPISNDQSYFNASKIR